MRLTAATTSPGWWETGPWPSLVCPRVHEASLPETLVDQAMLPECPEPIVFEEVQCLLAEVLPQDVLHVRDVLRKRGKVGEEPFRPFPAHMEFQRSGLHFARAPVPPLQKLRLLEWRWVIS